MPKQKKPNRIHCAECANCKLVRDVSATGRYILKARCKQGHWLKNGKEALVDHHNVGRRTRAVCPDYISTSEDESERKAYVDDLDEALPIERHIYEPDGSFVDKTETMKWDRNAT